jgi:hypothetical protein
MAWGSIWSFLVSNIGAAGVGALIAIIITNWLTVRRERAARSAQFKRQQLEEFYGPLLALHKEIRARRELRVKLQEAIDKQHFDAMMRGGMAGGPRGVAAASDDHVATIVTNVQDENTTFRDVLMPRYRDMVSKFREKMWLAEPQTRQFFPPLLEFVDVWAKILADKLPRSIAPAIGHTEANLKPFYEHLESVHDQLRSELK